MTYKVKVDKTKDNGMPPPPLLSGESQPPPPKPVASKQAIPLVQIPMDQLELCQTDQEKKQFLGNYLYQFTFQKLSKTTKEQAEIEALSGRITGMILDGQTIQFILYLCADKSSFNNIVDEALNLIQQSQNQTKV